ncbi:MAG TPA: efflux RND transporter periplasmic adaptor subunit [Ideonella sp.]|uniref:efflux RND transporter periplasmic adaptor subunit n=1 Tax=Ideonella sp. TaxID=1929293 RepID=UPI002E3428A6|nr:efflux RND transporter periplasmic adaptor subunit [Ideonella sp.]HEX5686493.1 efflux RND transporter periplasmic adaptor subunit [Ideonella sp.]
MKTPQRPTWIVSATLAAAGLAALGTWVHAADKPAAPAAGASAAQAALTVTTTSPQTTTLVTKLSANGSIAAWQEAVVGTEANGLRLAEVRANVGDVVKKGQVLATFAADTVQAELNQTRAAVGEAEATLAEAEANAQRARELSTTGALSAQQINQYLTAERTAKARLDAQKAMARVQELRLRQTQVLAPDNGVISSRSATVGAVLPAGMEMFRLIRQGRLEWRAEVPSSDLPRLKAGMAVNVALPTGSSVTGKLRMVAPTVDDKTRNALVYVDLPASAEARAGMFARGDFDIGSGQALTLPQSAVVLRDGFSYVLRVGADSKVAQTKVAVGRRVGDRVEVTSGVDANAKVVASGGAFLADGDLVRVVDAAAAKPVAKAASPIGVVPAATPGK